MTIRRWTVLWFLLMLCGLQAFAQEVIEPEFTPPRLSYMDGAVSFWRSGAEDWAIARINTPLAAGDGLYTSENANVEIQLGNLAFIRADGNTQLTLADQTETLLQFKVTGGRVSFDLRDMPADLTLEIDTPDAVFSIQRPGYYRVDVDDETHFTTRWGGVATVVPLSGLAQSILPSEQVVVQAGDPVRVSTYVAPNPDQWDRWNTTRTEDLIDSPSARYLTPGIAGADDLDHYGSWRVVADYGPVWVPDGVARDWAPYSTGSWVWDPYFEWTWIDDAPWGWAPYHYGRWVSINGYWAWAPGPIISHRPSYSPALVAFFSVGHDIAIGLRLGGAGVSWLALGWGEPLLPWWGRPEFRGRMTWRGWGGPQWPHDGPAGHGPIDYRNSKVPHAIVFDPDDHFGRKHGGGTAYRRLERVDGLAAIHGNLPVKPGRDSLVGAGTRGNRPPPAMLNRPVVAAHPTPVIRRPWSDSATHDGKPSAPTTRYVTPPSRPWTNLPRPEFGDQGSGERQRPPVTPRFGETRKPASPPDGANKVAPRKGSVGANESPRPAKRSETQTPPAHGALPTGSNSRQEAVQPRVPRDVTQRGSSGGTASSSRAMPSPVRGEGNAQASPRLPGKPANQTYRKHGQSRDDKDR